MGPAGSVSLPEGIPFSLKLCATSGRNLRLYVQSVVWREVVSIATRLLLVTQQCLLELKGKTTRKRLPPGSRLCFGIRLWPRPSAEFLHESAVPSYLNI